MRSPFEDKIGPKLPWTTFHILSRVNRGWRQALKDHQLYNARVRSQSMQMLIALHLEDKQSKDLGVIALYSVNDNSSYLLPPIPNTGPKFGIRWSCGQCISLDGKLSVLGGFKHSLGSSSAEDDGLVTSSDVYVIDLTGPGQWKQCASMRDTRRWFGCGVMNGKIYVFGGLSHLGPVCGSEVYDPTEDAWSQITPMLSFRFNPRVTIVGDELFVHHGAYIHSQEIYGSHSLDWARNEVVDLHVRATSKGSPLRRCDIHRALFAEVYGPLKNEWRIVENFADAEVILKVQGGKLHKISPLGFDVYNNHSNSWTHLPPCSLRMPRPNDFVEVDRWDFKAWPVEDKIIVLVRARKDEPGNVDAKDSKWTHQRLMSSQKMCGKTKEIVWRELQTLPPECVILSLFPYTIQL